jgi:hypothetical protein
VVLRAGELGVNRPIFGDDLLVSTVWYEPQHQTTPIELVGFRHNIYMKVYIELYYSDYEFREAVLTVSREVMKLL